MIKARHYESIDSALEWYATASPTEIAIDNGSLARCTIALKGTRHQFDLVKSQVQRKQAMQVVEVPGRAAARIVPMIGAHLGGVEGA
jgi:hypothetical protein